MFGPLAGRIKGVCKASSGAGARPASWSLCTFGAGRHGEPWLHRCTGLLSAASCLSVPAGRIAGRAGSSTLRVHLAQAFALVVGHVTLTTQHHCSPAEPVAVVDGWWLHVLPRHVSGPWLLAACGCFSLRSQVLGTALRCLSVLRTSRHDAYPRRVSCGFVLGASSHLRANPAPARTAGGVRAASLFLRSLASSQD